MSLSGQGVVQVRRQRRVRAASSAAAFVREGITGVLCPVGDVAGMAVAATAILGDDDRWHAMSEQAARDARQRFALADIVARYERFYRGDAP